MSIENFLKEIENTYSDDEYVNVVGDASDMVNFLNECLRQNIWFYKVYTVCVYLGKQIKGIFLEKKDIVFVSDPIYFGVKLPSKE